MPTEGTMKQLTNYCLAVATGVLLNLPIFAQQTLSGKIVDDQTNQPLPGASVRAGSLRGTTTNEKGEFSLKNIPQEVEEIEVSYIGYETKKHRTDGPEYNTLRLKRSVFVADEVVVSATRVTQKSAVAFTNVGKAELEKQNLGQDLPLLLNFTPSLVSTSDAGAGVGYTGFRIRGTDATRINVTINGIPYNDAESQGTFWVNMPDFASSVSSVQIQRGVGSSTNGAAAFGATVNIQTNEFRKESYAEINNSYGSFNTWKHTVKAGTGLIASRFTFDGRLSKISSAGFIDRAKTDLRSFYASGGYFGKKSMIRLNLFSGNEKTYQAWNGVPEARLRGNQGELLAFIERNYLNERNAQHLLQSSNRTYNSFLYENQTDNYRQDHYQLVSSHNLNPNWTLNWNAFFVRGKGYFEEFREDDKLSNYLIINQNAETADLTRRRWLDNRFYGTTFSLDYNNFKKTTANVGGGYNYYDGDHFGEVIWTRTTPNMNPQRYYFNKGKKTDFNLYGKIFYQFSDQFNAFADLQIRRVTHRISGTENSLNTVGADVNFTFFNPKAGLTYQLSENSSVYSSLSVANREPNRDDFTEAIAQNRPKPEQLLDWELGYRFQKGRFAGSLNGYYMGYQNQLVLTGQVNDVGNPVKTNVPKSYRAGVELELALALSKRWKWNGNATLSRNKINNFTELIFDYDSGDYLKINHGNSDISFSPNFILGSQLVYLPVKNMELALLTKYVSAQYLDNTSNETRCLEAYLTNDLRLICRFKSLTVSALANNLLNQTYESNGYTYSYVAGSQTTTENFYYPQAGRNFLVSLGLKF